MASNSGYALTEDQKAHWEREGFLTLKGGVSAAEIETVLSNVDWHWNNPQNNQHHVDVLTGDHAGRWFTMQETPSSVRSEVYKLNNLFALNPSIRSVALSRKLSSTFAELLDGEPLICNSLNFERGSQQETHIDSWYMPPPVDGMMVAASIALEDVDDQNGPIFFYPGSHKIPPYRFSDGRLNVIEAEFDDCRAYLEREIEKRNLSPVRFSGEAGDVFIWHGQLLHGGSAIENFSRTRNSLIVHYWRAKDVPASATRADVHGAYLGHTLRGELSY